MQDSAMKGFTNATDAADYLVNHGVPFRDAHGIIGRLVLYCIEQDIYDAISLEICVKKRMTIGAPGPDAMREVIKINKSYLEGEK